MLPRITATLLLACIALCAAAEEVPLYLTLDTPPAPELRPAEALRSFSIAPGYRVELAASEPQVEDPVAITWDEFGHLYVAEMRGFMPDAWGRGEKEPVGVVTRLIDSDGDGVFETRQVLQDALVLPRALAIINDGLLIGEPPNLWLCPTATGDAMGIDCTKKKRLGEYGNQPGSVEHAENGLLVALDNWIYNAKSDRRFKLIDGELEIEDTLFRGQWGITQDNAGRLYYNTNSSLLLGDLYDAQPVIAAGNKRAPGLNTPISRNDQLWSVRVNTGVNRAYVPGVLREDGRLDKPTSASGMVVYRGNQFETGNSDNQKQSVFIAEPAANVIVQLSMETGNLTAKTEHMLYPDEQWQQREFMASTDERFRPVDVEVGPDGALYVVDMYRGIIQDHVFLSDELREQALNRGLDSPVGMGRIWRIVKTEPQKQIGPSIDQGEQAQGQGGTNRISDNDDLVALLGHDNGWHRDAAQRLLLDKRIHGNRIDRQLKKQVTSDNTLAAVHAIWTLKGRNKLNRKTIRQALKHEHRVVRLAALRAGRAQLRRAQLLQLSRSENAEIAHHATLYLQDHNDHKRVIERLAGDIARFADNKIRLAGVFAAASGVEQKVIQQLINSRHTGDHTMAAIATLMTQSLRGNPDSAQNLLDLAMTTDDVVLQKAMLQGLSEAVRTDGFERIELPSPHALFSAGPDTLWSDIARVRLGFTWPDDDLQAGARPLSPAQEKRLQKGKQYFKERCAICHGIDGEGLASLGPPLANSEWVTGPTERLARIVLNGLQGPITVREQEWNAVMPGHSTIDAFNNEVASGLLTFLGRAWGHRGRAIEPAFMAEIRDIEKNRTSLWTAEELDQLDINTHYRSYEGVYGEGNFKLDIRYNGKGLSISSVYFNGELIETAQDEFLFEPRQFRLEFNWEDGKVNAIRMPGQDGAMLPRVAP